MLSGILPTEEYVGNLKEVTSSMDPNSAVGSLSVSLQSCEPFSIADSESSKSLIASDIPGTGNLVCAFNSVIISEPDEQRDLARIDNAKYDDVGQAEFPEGLRLSTRRSTSTSKNNQKTEAKKAARKSRRIADKRALLDLLFLKVARRQRSGMRKQARSSPWGLLKHVTEIFEQNVRYDVDQTKHIELLKPRTAQSGANKNNNLTIQSSQVSKSETQTYSRCIRLKVKLGKKQIPGCLLNMGPAADNNLDKYREVMIKSPELSSDGDGNGKLEKDVVTISISKSLNENLDNAALLSEASILDVHLADNYSRSDGKSADILHGIPCKDGVGRLEETVEERCLDPGTSPDSEVINVNPEPQSRGIMSEDLEDVLTLTKDVAHEDLASVGLSETSSEIAKSEKNMYQESNSVEGVGLPGPGIIIDSVSNDNSGQKEILGDVWYNCVSISTTLEVAASYASSSEGCHTEPLHSSQVTTVGGSAETLKAESGGEVELSSCVGLESPESRISEKLVPISSKGRKLPKSFKSNRNRKSRSELSESKNRRQTDSPQRGFEAKSIGECKIKDKNDREVGSKGQSYPETGIEENVDNGLRSMTGDSSNLAVVPSGTRDQRGSLRNAWVCCDDCHKWRRIPAILADSIETTNCKWICKDNLDKTFGDCSIPQEKSNADINAELEISDEEDNYGTRMNSNQFGQQQPKAVPLQSPWKVIRSNLFLHRNRKNQSIDEIMVCHCKPPPEGRRGCRDGCLNRLLSIECVKGTCPCGELCSNQRFQKRKYAKLKYFRTGKKGYGLQLQEDIPQGRFLIEYVGEVLDMHSYEARQREYALKGHKHFYFMTLNGSEVIDACAKGNLGRFINHSCEPNCRTEKWMVNGEVCIGLFAMRDIKKGEEVTFDYNYVRVFGAAAKKCVCGSSKCRGYIGGDPLNAEVIVQGDSDDEYPEPVMLYEHSNDKLDNMTSETGPFDGAETIPKNNVEMDKCATAVEHVEITKEKESTGTLSEATTCNVNPTIAVRHMEVASESEGLIKGFSSVALKSDNFLELEGSVSNLPASVQPIATLSKPIQSENPTNNPGGEEDENRFLRNVERNVTSSLNVAASNLLPNSIDVKKSKSETDETARLTLKSHPRTKTSRPSSLVKRRNPKNNAVNITKAPLIENQSIIVPCRSKKLSHASLDGRFEAVQQKLNELLDADGGISKRKDASRGYLKLLYLTVASGDSGTGEGIQSNRDLSMILDALLKTKSRSVLADIINKNGLQMLHNIMKRYRREFNKIPILRKLLKVLEYLAVREILTSESINRGPPRPGVVSFRESILELTEHLDKQVHQIARNFRDRWIHRRKHKYMEKDVDMIDAQRGSNFNRFSASHDHSSDQEGRPIQSIDHCAQQSPSINTPPLDGATVEGSIASCASSCISNGTRTRKRKSRWDQPAESTSPSNKEAGFLLPKPNLRAEVENGWPGLNHVSDVSSESKSMFDGGEAINVLDERQNDDEDGPPGFSSPLKRSLVRSNAYISGTGADPCEAVMGNPQERFISRMSISYGVPLSLIQQLETPQGAPAESWIISPAMPFQPFPPLPSYPRDNRGLPPASNNVTMNLHVEQQPLPNPATFPCEPNQNPPTTSGGSTQDVAIPGLNNQHNSLGVRGSSNSLGRKYFRQQKWKNSRPVPPWIQRNIGWGGFKGTNNSSNGMGSTGMISGGNGLQGPYMHVAGYGTLSSGSVCHQQPHH